MTNPQHTSHRLNAKRVAALLAGFDTGNLSDEEALSKGLALRRVAAEANTRIVDLLELPEVRKAIDDQMQPTRHEGPALQAAQRQIASLQEELTERTRDVRKMLEVIAASKQRGNPPSRNAIGEALNGQSGALEAGVVILALLLMCMAICR